MRHHDRKRKARRQDILKALGLFGAIIATVLFCMWYFPQIDCKNAHDGLEFIARCEADPNCELRAQDLNLKRALTRLEIKACPKK